MPLNPTGSEIPRSLTQVTTTIDAALDLKVDLAAYQNAGGIDAGIWKEQLDLTGVNTGDQDLSSYATTSAVAAGYQPLDADLTAIAALTTTSTGRALLTESVAQTGTGALVRASAIPGKSNKVIAHFPLRKTLVPAIGSGVGVFSRNFEGVAEQEDGSYLEYAHLTPSYGRYGLGFALTTFSSILGYNAPSFSRDLTLAAWTKTNCTVAKTVRGIDKTANVCTAITATSANATVLFAVTAANAARTFSAFVKRLTGTGAIAVTQDGGTTWTDVSDQVAFGIWQRITLTQTVTNPSVGFRVSTSGDVIAVDAVACVNSIYPGPPILSRSADRSADSLALTSIPVPRAGERYLIEITTKIEHDSSSTGTGITWTNNAGNAIGAGLIIGSQNRINSFRNSLLLVNQAGTYVPVVGDNITIGVVAGMGTIEPTINGRRAGVYNDGATGGDGVSNAGYILPTGMNQLNVSGGGWISDAKITQIATLNAVSFGDSIANGVTQPLLDRLGPEIVVRQKGVGFATVANMVTRFPFVTSECYQTKAIDNVVIVWGGSNSLAAGVSSASALTDMQTVVTGLVNDGWKVCVCTMLDRRAGLSISQGTFDTARAAFNTGLATLTGVTTLIDTANMTNLTNASNGTYFSDSIHPTLAGYAIACVGDSTRPGILAAITSFA
jgi:hypothetical protein